MTVCYRLCWQGHAANSGYGAEKRGGRWNPKGIPVIYAAATVSLAALEILANSAFLPQDYTATEIQIPTEMHIEYVALDSLPRDWDAPVPISETKDIGARWIQQQRSGVLCVPSSVSPTERNFVINPRHPDFPLITFGSPRSFKFDPRLKAVHSA
ncbi:MAG: RES domain-containing protein [Acidobacteriaceae bacterium]|nr:RES domain-containing protein [Acidobacteriaceae bacterium]MBV9296233.1 RES domain-containing protein [Acidobacteriaceae bacterium]